MLGDGSCAVRSSPSAEPVFDEILDRALRRRQHAEAGQFAIPDNKRSFRLQFAWAAEVASTARLVILAFMVVCLFAGFYRHRIGTRKGIWRNEWVLRKGIYDAELVL